MTTKNLDYIRADFLFSNWIFTWFLIYYLLLLKGGRGVRAAGAAESKGGIERAVLWTNPSVALWMGLLENMAFLLYLTFYANLPVTTLIKFSAVLFFEKALPLYLISGRPIHFARDFAATAVLFGLYVFWLNINEITVTDVYKKTSEFISRGENKTPLFMLMGWIGENLTSVVRFFVAKH